MINQKVFETAIDRICHELYKSERHFIDDKAHERTIVADFIAPLLRDEFSDWNVNTEYNREGVRRVSKRDMEGNLLLPDIIVHKRGPDGPNAVAMQVKGYWNREKRSKDENKLRRLREKHRYTYLYRLELGKDKHDLIPVD